jgi:hypothetical protein
VTTNKYLNNEAPYGKDISSYPVKASLVTPSSKEEMNYEADYEYSVASGSASEVLDLSLALYESHGDLNMADAQGYRCMIEMREDHTRLKVSGGTIAKMQYNGLF